PAQLINLDRRPAVEALAKRCGQRRLAGPRRASDQEHVNHNGTRLHRRPLAGRVRSPSARSHPRGDPSKRVLADPHAAGAQPGDLAGAMVEQLEHDLADRLRGGDGHRVADMLAHQLVAAVELDPLTTRVTDLELRRIARSMPDRDVLQEHQLGRGHRPVHGPVGRADDHVGPAGAFDDLDRGPDEPELAIDPRLSIARQWLASDELVRGLKELSAIGDADRGDVDATAPAHDLTGFARVENAETVGVPLRDPRVADAARAVLDPLVADHRRLVGALCSADSDRVLEARTGAAWVDRAVA